MTVKLFKIIQNHAVVLNHNLKIKILKFLIFRSHEHFEKKYVLISNFFLMSFIFHSTENHIATNTAYKSNEVSLFTSDVCEVSRVANSQQN